MKVEISGKFQTRKEKGFGHLNSSNYQFLIEKINSITYVNEDIPYPN